MILGPYNFFVFFFFVVHRPKPSFFYHLSGCPECYARRRRFTPFSGRIDARFVGDSSDRSRLFPSSSVRTLPNLASDRLIFHGLFCPLWDYCFYTFHGRPWHSFLEGYPPPKQSSFKRALPFCFAPVMGLIDNALAGFFDLTSISQSPVPSLCGLAISLMSLLPTPSSPRITDPAGPYFL